MNNTSRSYVLSIITATLLLCSSVSSAQCNELRLGKIGIHLTDQCKVAWRIIGKNAISTIEVSLPYPETCDFVRISGTNVIRVERYYDAWVVLIESHKKINSDEKDARYGCDTKFKGLIVRDDGKVFLNPEVNGGSGCPPIDRGRLAYISLAHDYVHIRE